MIAILILNWNGWKDTIDCLESIQKMHYTNYFVVLGDNGSTDDSKVNIVNYCKKHHIVIEQDTLGQDAIHSAQTGSVILYDLETNNGFAKGNNLMIHYSRRFNPDYFFLLNNDTVVMPDCMTTLCNFKLSHTEYDVLTPLIPYYYEKDKVWNAGGVIFWGFRKYNYADKSISSIKEEEYIPCTFVTGCAMLFSAKCLRADGNLFSETFFFGEDDFELALRFKSEGIKQACVLKSKIYHKVSSSTSTAPSHNKIYIHYLNRYINLRQNMNAMSYLFWRYFNNVYLFYLLKRNGFCLSEIWAFLKKLNSDSLILNGVDKHLFEKTLCINKD